MQPNNPLVIGLKPSCYSKILLFLSICEVEQDKIPPAHMVIYSKL